MQTADEFLHAFHATHPGATDHAFRGGVLEGEGGSSYDLLARFVATEAGGEVAMDLACGDGALTARILEQPDPPAVVIGVDASAAELKKARKRIRRRAVFHNCPAQALPTPSGEVSAVGCHMALMLISPVEPVLDHVARVLVPGGALGAIVPSGLGGAGAVYLRLLAGHRSDRPPLGDARIRSEEGLRVLLSERFERVEVSDHVLSMEGTAASLWSDVLSTTYDVFALPEAEQEQLREAFLREVGGGAATMSMGLRFARAWTAR